MKKIIIGDREKTVEKKREMQEIDSLLENFLKMTPSERGKKVIETMVAVIKKIKGG